MDTYTKVVSGGFMFRGIGTRIRVNAKSASQVTLLI